jgi:hypothetical protein
VLICAAELAALLVRSRSPELLARQKAKRARLRPPADAALALSPD